MDTKGECSKYIHDSHSDFHEILSFFTLLALFMFSVSMLMMYRISMNFFHVLKGSLVILNTSVDLLVLKAKKEAINAAIAACKCDVCGASPCAGASAATATTNNVAETVASADSGANMATANNVADSITEINTIAANAGSNVTDAAATGIAKKDAKTVKGCQDCYWNR